MMRRCFFIMAILLAAQSISAQDFSKYVLKVRNLDSVNSLANDYAPWVTNNQTSILYFTSNRNPAQSSLYSSAIREGARKDKRYDANSTDIGLESRIQKSTDSMAIIGELSATLRSTTTVIDANNYPFCYSSTAKGGYGNSDIYFSFSKWVNTAPDAMYGTDLTYNLGSNVNSSAWDAQPCISADGNTIYFVSNRNKSNKTDIYVTHRINDSTWTDAQALGTAINSTEDERSPFVSRDGTRLFFARNMGGEQRNYDVFMCQRQNTATEEWSQPQRLPEPINSPYDDLFLHAPEGSEVFYLCSNRQGGKGGLDIYEIKPNIFSGATFSLNICASDSLTGCDLRSSLRISDTESGAVLMESDSVQCKGELKLLAGREYDIHLLYRNQEKSIHINADSTRRDAFSPYIIQAQFNSTTFDFSDQTIPFFVTGYYRLNTVKGLQDLFVQKKGRLKNVSYIEQFEENSPLYQEYLQHARTAEAIFSRVARTAVDTVFPCFLGSTAANEYVELRIYGYSDSKPITGRFSEDKAVEYEDTRGQHSTVKKGDVLSNESLSGLRAAYATEYINTIFSAQSAQYRSLMQQGRIVLRSIAGNNNTSSTDNAAQRRIRIEFERKKK